MPERRSCLVWLGGVQCLNHLVLVKEAQTTQDRENFSRCGLMEVNRQKRTIGCLSLDKGTLGVQNSQDREKLLQMLSDGCQSTETHHRVPLTQQKNTWSSWW